MRKPKMSCPAIPFDTLYFANSLKEVGVPSAQAERQAQLMAETITNQLATKRDLEELANKLVIKLGSIVAVLLTIGLSILGYILKH